MTILYNNRCGGIYEKVIAGTCLFMILLVGCGGKNNNQVSNEERNANIPEVIKIVIHKLIIIYMIYQNYLL